MKPQRGILITFIPNVFFVSSPTKRPRHMQSFGVHVSHTSCSTYSFGFVDVGLQLRLYMSISGIMYVCASLPLLICVFACLYVRLFVYAYYEHMLVGDTRVLL